MDELIKSLEIKGFRGFSELSVPDLGKVNLITGKNNAGKSSLLEAIRILVDRGSLETIREILNYREEINEKTEREFDEQVTDLGPFRSLFTGFPSFNSAGVMFSIKSSGRIKFPSLSINAAWAIRQQDDEKGGGYEIVTTDRFGEPNSVPVLEITSGERRWFQLLEGLPLQHIFRRSRASPYGGDEQIRCVFLDPSSSKTTGQLGALWDAISLTDLQKEVVNALQFVSPDIEAVSMIGENERFPRLHSRTAIVRSRQFDAPVPLRTFGDGVNRLFGIILSLCNARGGVLLVDEIESGLHYSVQPLVWETIFRLAGDLDVQVFATTHSSDCVHAFQKAADASKFDGALIRLSRESDRISSTLFNEYELGIAASNDIEVR